MIRAAHALFKEEWAKRVATWPMAAQSQAVGVCVAVGLDAQAVEACVDDAVAEDSTTTVGEGEGEDGGEDGSGSEVV